MNKPLFHWVLVEDDSILILGSAMLCFFVFHTVFVKQDKNKNNLPESDISSQYGESNSYSALRICRKSSESFS